MPRKPIERHPVFPYHVYNRSIDKLFYPVDLKEMWEHCCKTLCTLSWGYNAKVHAFVLMGNHYHLLMSTPSENLDECICYFQTTTSKWLYKNTGKGVYSFGSRYKWSIIKDPFHYSAVYKYVYQNPLRASLVDKAELYPYSTLSGKYGVECLHCPIAPHEFDGAIPERENTSELEWINSLLAKDALDRTRLGLGRTTFTPPNRVRGTRA